MNFDFDILFTPQAAIAVIGGLALLLAVIARPQASLLVLGIMLFVGALANPSDTGDSTVVIAWTHPLAMQRSILYLLCGGLLTVGMFFNFAKISFNSISATGLLLLLVAGYAAVMQFYHVGFSEGILTLLSAILTIGSLAVLLPSLLRDGDDFLTMLRTVVFASVVYALAVLVQLGINRSALIVPNAFRFQGLSGNPQFVAVFLAVSITSTSFLILNDTSKRFKGLYVGLMCLNVVLLGWTGSRTGTLMTIVGVASVFYTRLGQTILFAPFLIGGIVGIVSLMESSGIDLGLDRLTSTQDTRTGVWGALVENSLANPVFGAGMKNAGAAENSYLLATASYGFGSLFTLLLLTAGVGIQCARLLLARRHMSPLGQRFVDLQIGFYTMYFAGSMFEGYIIARVSVMLPLFMMFSAMTSRLLEIEATGRRYGEQDARLADSESASGSTAEQASSYGSTGGESTA